MKSVPAAHAETQVLITGASGGIGEAAARLLESRGFGVIKVDHDDADLSKYIDIERLVARIVQQHGSLDWVVYSHGYIDTETDFAQQKPENIETTVNVNTLSILHLTRLLLPHVRNGIVFVSSSTAIYPNGRYAVYSASKAAVNAFTQALARNRPERSFIAVCPGRTNTAMRAKIAGDAAESQSPAIVAEVIANIVRGSSPYKNGDVVLVKDGVDSLHHGLLDS